MTKKFLLISSCLWSPSCAELAASAVHVHGDPHEPRAAARGGARRRRRRLLRQERTHLAPPATGDNRYRLVQPDCSTVGKAVLRSYAAAH